MHLIYGTSFNHLIIHYSFYAYHIITSIQQIRKLRLRGFGKYLRVTVSHPFVKGIFSKMSNKQTIPKWPSVKLYTSTLNTIKEETAIQHTGSAFGNKNEMTVKL